MKYFILALVLGFAKAQSDCQGVPDGTVIDWACRAYTYCENGQPVIEDCSDHGQVFNPEIQACDDPANTPAPCGETRPELCAHFGNGRFADLLQGCEYYYTCVDGLYFGHNVCVPGTVFDEVLCLCNFPQDVYVPCGTKADDGNKPDTRGCPLN